jgi:hypothetical protein
MKKINNYFVVAALVAASFTFGCKKDDKTTSDAANGTATISGIIKFDSNTANDTGSTVTSPMTTYESIPAGVVITASINTKYLVLNPDPSLTYPTKEYRTTVNTDGTYSLTVDANEKSVPVTISVNDFRYDKISPDPNLSYPTDYRKPVTTKQVLYSGYTITNVSVVNGDSKIIADEYL